jgi:hypothetical protein
VRCTCRISGPTGHRCPVLPVDRHNLGALAGQPDPKQDPMWAASCRRVFKAVQAMHGPFPHGSLLVWKLPPLSTTFYGLLLSRWLSSCAILGSMLMHHVVLIIAPSSWINSGLFLLPVPHLSLFWLWAQVSLHLYWLEAYYCCLQLSWPRAPNRVFSLRLDLL